MIFFKKQNLFNVIDLLILQERIYLRIIANEEYIEKVVRKLPII